MCILGWFQFSNFSTEAVLCPPCDNLLTIGAVKTHDGTSSFSSAGKECSDFSEPCVILGDNLVQGRAHCSQLKCKKNA